MLTIGSSIRRAKTTDGAVLLDIRHNRILTMNAMGAAIFELIADGRNETEIVEEISRAFDVPAQIVAVDVREFLESLRNRGILAEKQSCTGAEVQR